MKSGSLGMGMRRLSSLRWTSCCRFAICFGDGAWCIMVCDGGGLGMVTPTRSLSKFLLFGGSEDDWVVVEDSSRRAVWQDP